MAITYEAIATTTVGAGGASTIDFQSIPSTYTDLCLKVSSRDSSSNNLFSVYFNNDTTTSNYSGKYLQGNGTSPSSGNNSGSWYIPGAQNTSSFTANTFASTDFYIPNYTSSNKKSVSVDGVQETNASGAWQWLSAALWSGTAAINRVTVAGIGANLVQYTTATLYGIKNTV